MKSGLTTISGRESRTGMAETPIEITACYHEFGSRRIFDSEGSARRLLIRKEFWLRGKDLNLRPLGYEFDLYFVWVHAVPYISVTYSTLLALGSSCFRMLFVGSGSKFGSTLLRAFGLRSCPSPMLDLLGRQPNVPRFLTDFFSFTSWTRASRTGFRLGIR